MIISSRLRSCLVVLPQLPFLAFKQFSFDIRMLNCILYNNPIIVMPFQPLTFIFHDYCQESRKFRIMQPESLSKALDGQDIIKTKRNHTGYKSKIETYRVDVLYILCAIRSILVYLKQILNVLCRFQFFWIDTWQIAFPICFHAIKGMASEH